jgi:uncharacterized protein involved in exopolysaccharide biosynthesis
MPDLFTLFRNWWKPILLVLVLSLVTTGVFVFTQRPEYRSVATAVPASTYSADKAKIFNNNIDQLYSALGSPDDLDLVLGTGKLDTVYLAVTRRFNLQDHYKTEEKGEAAITKAALLLKKKCTVVKSEYGELKVSVWDTDKQLAPQLANAVLAQLQSIHQHLQQAGNEASLQSLLAMKEKLMIESALTKMDEVKVSISVRLAEYDKLIAEYQLVLSNPSLALIVVENARVSEWPDRPKRVQWMLGTAVLALLFGLLIAAVLESRKNRKA